ncbi:MAG: hypothetical protein ACFFD4_15820, partial [Candidatus Odinarchaeota archaeon]
REDLVLESGIPPFVIEAVYDYLNSSIEINLDEMTGKEIEQLDLLSLEIAENNIDTLSLYSALDFNRKIMTIKKLLSFSKQLLDPKIENDLDMSFLVQNEKEKIDTLALKLLDLARTKNKYSIDEIARILHEGFYTTRMATQHYNLYQSKEIDQEKALTLIKDVSKLDPIARSYLSRSELPETGLTNYWRMLAYLDLCEKCFTTRIPITYSPAFLRRTAINKASITALEFLKAVNDTKSLMKSFIAADHGDLTLFDFAIATNMLLRIADWQASAEHFKVADHQLDVLRVEKNLKTILEISKGTTWEVQEIMERASIGIHSIIEAQYYYTSIQTSTSSRIPDNGVVSEIEKYIQSGPATALWAIFLERYSPGRPVLEETFTALRHVKKSMVVKPIEDIASLPMNERLKLNDQAVMALKLLRDKHEIRSYLDLVKETGLSPLELSRTLSYALSVDELNALIGKIAKNLSFKIENSEEVVDEIELEMQLDLKKIKTHSIEKMPALKLTKSKITIKDVQFKKI